ncbi:hypothetical protein [Bacillus sp. ISL-45]|uniref:hypothetical protein n=1 Tax=Bacillus sp. ISL-45 TaxID=2819128 RepID=UPI001BE4EFF3|nr:hypothetical protein [Bacillus sp. ISL-45]MBT2661599.1 hypothetical protein [Bacillus sp. ISL-45]
MKLNLNDTQNQIVACLLVATTLFISPSLLSLSYSFVGIILALLSLFTFIVLFKKHTNIFPIALSIIVFNCLYWFFILMQTLIISDTESEYLLQTSIINLTLLMVYSILLSDKDLNYSYFRNFIKLIYLLCLSFAITSLLSQVMNFEKLNFMQVNIGSYHTGGTIYFPVTAIYGIMHTGDLALPKFQLFFRESGIAQAFIIWSIFNLKKFNLNKKRIYFILHFGLIGTFSTTAIAIYFVTLAYFLILRGKMKFKQAFLSLVILFGAYFGVMNLPYVGIQDKLITHSASIEDRLINNLDGARELLINPLGTGFKANDNENDGISIIALSSKIGLVGLILVILTFFGPLMFSKEKRVYFGSILPIFLTALLAQPIAGDTMIGVILLSLIFNKDNYLKEGEQNEENFAL